MMPASLGILHAVPRTVLFSTGAVACGLTRHVDPFIATDGSGQITRGATMSLDRASRKIALAPGTTPGTWRGTGCGWGPAL